MKSKLTRGLMLAAVTLVAAGSVWAQNKVTAKIPFEFTVGNKTLAAGDYAIGEIGSHESDVLLLRNTGTGKNTLAQAGSPLYQDLDGRARLVFRCGASGCALVRIWNGSSGYVLSPGHGKEKADDRIAVVYFNRPNATE
jgi:hypothetical protein